MGPTVAGSAIGLGIIAALVMSGQLLTVAAILFVVSFFLGD